MSREKQKRNRTIHVVIVDAIMAISVVAIVGILMMLVMGYNVKHDEEQWGLEQSGLVQIASVPSGANIDVDGERLLQRTETSRMMTEGEHTIKLSRDGYDAWEKTVTVRPGYFLRLKYPRLFKTDLAPETALNLPTNTKWHIFSSNRNFMLYAVDDSPVWHLVSLRGDNLSDTELDTTDIILSDPDYHLWSQNGERLLVRTSGENPEWLMLNLKDIKNSINITKEFGLNFSTIRMADNAATKLWVLENSNLRLINLDAKELSGVLINNVASFANNKDELVYVTTPDTENTRIIGTYSEGDEESVTVKKVKDSNDAIMVALEDYLGDTYLSYTIGQKFYSFKDDEFPAPGQKFQMELVTSEDLAAQPSGLSASLNGQFAVMSNNSGLTIFDTETEKLYSYEIPAPYFWVDDYLLGNIAENNLTLRDFDGTNLRTSLIKDAASPAIISANNRYLYYFSATSQALMRVRL